MPTVVKAHTPADMLALIPHLLGEAPRNSIVFATFRGNRTHAALRFDLPPAAVSTGPKAPLIHKRIASTAIGTLCKIPGTEAVNVAVFTDEPIGPDGAVPRAHLVDLLRRRIITAGFEVRGTLCQASTGWAEYGVVVPPGGFPLMEILEAAARTSIPQAAIERLRMPLPERIPDADDATRDRVRTKYAYLVDALRTSTRLDELPTKAAPQANVVMFLESVMGWDDGQLDKCDFVLLQLLQGPTFRDVAMLQWAIGIGVGYEAQDEASSSNGYSPDFSFYLAGLILGKGPRPDVGRVRTGIAILEKLIARADDALRPAPLCMLAWLTWALGLSSRAHVYVAEALRIDPHYGLAELLEGMLNHGMLPEWAFDAPGGDERDRP
jgi:hypothetical protein